MCMTLLLLSCNPVKRLSESEYSALLKESGTYIADTTLHLHFEYEEDSVWAEKVRAYFQLDTIYRPELTTWENTLNIARFINRNIPHANQKAPVEKCNAIDLWEYHLNVEPGINCRWHSVIMHEMLLSLGIINRFVTCEPEDSEDNDCHVVNVVWLKEYEKWAMIDTDQGAYVTDKNSDIPLSLEEMRNNKIAGIPMEYHFFENKLDPDYYSRYWAKNLYWFECWEKTGYDKETSYDESDGRLIALVPQGFEAYYSGRTCTSDAGQFWQKPQ